MIANIVLLIISEWKVCITVNSIIVTTSCKKPTSINNHFENNHFVSQSNTFSKTFVSDHYLNF